jgi:hypothetical protein
LPLELTASALECDSVLIAHGAEIGRFAAVARAASARMALVGPWPVALVLGRCALLALLAPAGLRAVRPRYRERPA